MYTTASKSAELAIESKAGQPCQEPEIIVPEEYHDLLYYFSKQEATEVPPSRAIDHKIKLTKWSTPSFQALNMLSETELEVLQDYLESNSIRDGYEHPPYQQKYVRNKS